MNLWHEHLTKIKSIKIKAKKSKEILPKDELIGEFIGYKKQFTIKTKYIFENDKAVSCYNEIESNNEIFLESYINDGLTKNLKRNGNVLSYEWNDKYFEQKGKNCSKDEIKQFLKAQKYKIKK